MIEILSYSDLPEGRISPEDAIVFGGTFDPFHTGHLSVVTSLLIRFRTVIIAPTTQNPWKTVNPTEITKRREMIKIVLEAEGIPSEEVINATGVVLFQKDYTYAEEVVNTLRKLLKGKLYWAVGEDGRASVKSWKNWEQLSVPVVVLPITEDIHATDVRSGSFSIHPALENYVRRHSLYGY